MKKYINIIILTLFVSAGAFAQKNEYCAEFLFTPSEAVKDGDVVRTGVLIQPTEVKFHRQQMVTFTPVLLSADGANSYAFDPVVILGRTRDKAMKREIRLRNFEYDREPVATVRYLRKDKPEIMIDLEAPYEPWMRGSFLELDEIASGCANCLLADNNYRLSEKLLPAVYVPEYTFAYIAPEVEIKERKESYTARINFRNAKSDIDYNYMGNSRILDEVNAVIRRVANDPDLTITKVNVTGYASPEGYYDRNMRLSQDRANSFVGYIRRIHRIDPKLISANWEGEDWNGLRKLLEEGYMSYAYDVLNIIDNEYDIQRRKDKIRWLNGGNTYRSMLNDVYPLLRRIEYDIAYVARPFSPEEAVQVIKHSPQHLSLDEMYQVANLYPKDSKEFKEVFDIASRLYPDDPVAILNGATLSIEQGAHRAGIDRLLRIVDLPEALNNIGLAYLQMGDVEAATEYLKRAEDKGLETATRNLQELNLWLENPE